MRGCLSAFGGFRVAAGQYRITHRGAGLTALVKEALGEAAGSGSPAVAGLMAGAVRDITALLTAPPQAAEKHQLQVLKHSRLV